MTEYFKQIFDAWGDRIRSPFVGSILVAFGLVNWKPLFVLFFADLPILDRISYFEASTSTFTLYVLPAVIGIVAALVVPWTIVFGAFLGKFPKARLHGIHHVETVNKRIFEYGQKADEEEAIAKLEAAREQRKIGAARRLNEAVEIGSDVADALKEDRVAGHLPHPSQFDDLSKQSLEILQLAKNAKQGKIFVKKANIYSGNPSLEASPLYSFGDGHRAALSVSDSLTDLKTQKYFKSLSSSLSDYGEYEITLDGYEFLDDLGL